MKVRGEIAIRAVRWREAQSGVSGHNSHRPKYLVLDEPMAGLDPLGRKVILDTIMKLKQALGCAVIMVSHSMDDVEGVNAHYSNEQRQNSYGRHSKEIFMNAEKLLR